MAEALKNLLSKSTLDKITVKEITDSCGVKRQTFYYHFKDIYDLLEWTFLQEGEQIVDRDRLCETWQDVYLEVFRYIEKNKNFTINAYNSVGREHLERFLYRIVYDLIDRFLRQLDKAEKIKKEDRHFICDFYKFGLVGIILEWLGTGMKDDPEVLTGKLTRLLQRHIEMDLLELTEN